MSEPEEIIIPLLEETISVSKAEVVTGRVRVTTHTDTVDETVNTRLNTETVSVTRVPIDREVDVAPQVRTEGDVTIIPVLEEIVIVEKRLVLKEEIHILRVSTAQDVSVPVTLRKQRAELERTTVPQPDNFEEKLP
ncbi:YsnF/AvaK domain-containing protein [Rhizobium sp. CFBP 8762]|uniref:YsnF/AvaK domain-containing protein n=1 Tax=Rhizobium sp. CFBP 8762 TaxID=2775279 RepID=UPI00177D4104|nr:YsnF/AvaK domain-containing protein [Rhizobium sp. CFBP 8762]MBD8554323.1 YsnF/AvaK domain-containing protein [Rhizobium sp. CFBP 8762]